MKAIIKAQKTITGETSSNLYRGIAEWLAAVKEEDGWTVEIEHIPDEPDAPLQVGDSVRVRRDAVYRSGKIHPGGEGRVWRSTPTHTDVQFADIMWSFYSDGTTSLTGRPGTNLLELLDENRGGD